MTASTFLVSGFPSDFGTWPQGSGFHSATRALVRSAACCWCIKPGLQSALKFIPERARSGLCAGPSWSSQETFSLWTWLFLSGYKASKKHNNWFFGHVAAAKTRYKHDAGIVWRLSWYGKHQSFIRGVILTAWSNSQSPFSSIFGLHLFLREISGSFAAKCFHYVC